MCGIVGALTFDAFEKKSDERIRTEASIYITTQILQATVERGKDATGISLLWSDGNYSGLKMGIPSPEFISRFGGTEKDFEGILKLWREYPKLMKIFIGHCRKSSVGNSYDNKNNHPLQIGNIIMIHNGTLTNHETIFDKLDCKRSGDVDSEAIGRLLHHYTNGGNEPFTTDMIEEVTRRLAGTYSVLAMSGNNPYQVAQFRDGRPAEMVLVRPLKTVYIASEKKFLENVLFEYNKQAKLFSTGVNFPYLKQADVEFKMLQDDSCAVWDLTVPITDKTELADLYDWKKTPLRVDKIWGTVTNTYNRSSVNNTGTDTQKKSTEVNAQSKKTGATSAEDDDKNSDGLVWSKALNKYKTQDGIEETKNCGAVTIDVESGKVSSVEGDDEDIGIKDVSPAHIENLITGAADVKELGIKRTKDATTTLVNGVKKNIESDVVDGGKVKTDDSSIIEIDMTADPEALKRAEEYVEKGIVKYESDEEVAVDIEATDAAILRPLPLYALANRIKKFIFKQGFYAGFTTAKAEIKPAVAPDKSKSAEKKIRLMKMVIKVLAAALELRCKGNTPKAIKEMIQMVVDDIFKPTKEAKVDISLAFSIGDLKKIPMLKQIKEQLHKD